MTRGDTRLLAVIVVTAAVTSVMTVVAVRIATPGARPPPRQPEPALARVEPAPVAIAPARTEPAPVATDPALCDEVECVIRNYEAPCCAQYHRPKLGDPALPDHVDRALIVDGVAAVKARVLACGERSSAKGVVKVGVKVAPDGTPTVTVKLTPDPALGDCVRASMEMARFARTNNGGSFSYPFVF